MGKVAGLSTLNILKTARVMLMNTCIVNTGRCQILFWKCKVFSLFQQIFAYEKVIPKNGLHWEIKFTPHPQLLSSALSIILMYLALKYLF